MSNYQLLLGLAIGLIIAGVIYWLIPILKGQKQANTEEIKKVVIDVVKQALKLTTFKTEEEMKQYCIDLIKLRLSEQGITDFTDEEIKMMIDLLLTQL